MQNRSNRGSGKPAIATAPRARAYDWDPTPRIALGPAAMYAAPKGRTHGSTRPACINVTKSRRTKRPDTWQHPTSLHGQQNLLPTGSRPHMGPPTSLTPRIALGPAAMYAAPKGRTHGSTRPACINVTKSSCAGTDPADRINQRLHVRRPHMGRRGGPHPTSLHRGSHLGNREPSAHGPHQSQGRTAMYAAPKGMLAGSTSQNLLPTGSRPRGSHGTRPRAGHMAAPDHPQHRHRPAPAAMYGRTHDQLASTSQNLLPTGSRPHMGPDPADRIRASGHVRRTKRPDTWQHPTSLHQRHKISCQQGAVHTCTPHQKAGHMAAPDQLASTSQNLLPTGSRPHMAEAVEKVPKHPFLA